MSDLEIRPRPLWSGLGPIGPLQARLAGPLPVAGSSGISIDTRTLQPGDLFFAIKGERSDGHDYVEAAFAKGAAAAVVDEGHAEALMGAGSLYVVRDVMAALEGLGAAARARSKARIIAVTGSVGKTSTKEALRLVLGEMGETHAAAASYNNHLGVPLTLARMPVSARYGVFEIGMNHSGEITPLTAFVRPHVAIVTNVGPVHIEAFGSVEAIADAKAEIFSGLEADGTAVIPRDSEHYERLRDHAERSPAGHIVTFGEHAEADARLVSVALARDWSDVTAVLEGERLTYRVGAPGKHLVMNSLAVLAAAKAAGADVGHVANTYARLAPPTGRGARIVLNGPGGSFTIIDESYNANPISMRAALALLRLTPPGPLGRRIAVLGDMLELGPETAALHADLADAVADSKANLLFAAGPQMKTLYDAVPEDIRAEWAATSAGIVDAVIDAVYSGDVLMVKGSNGSRMAAVIEALENRFASPKVAATEAA